MNPHFRPLVRAIFYTALCLVIVLIVAGNLLLRSDVTITEKHIGVAVLGFGCLCTFITAMCVAVQAKRYGSLRH
jgi:hypothetical protein